MDMMYFLVQWEDRFVSVINPSSVVNPKKSMMDYKDGEVIEAIFKKQKYKAVISEIHPNRKYLMTQTKMPLKHAYDSVQNVNAADTEAATAVRQMVATSGPAQASASMMEKAVPQTILPPTVAADTEAAMAVRQMEATSGPAQASASMMEKAVPQTTLLPTVENPKASDLGLATPQVPVSCSSQQVPLVTGQYMTKEDFHILKEDIRHLRSKVRKLEDKVGSLARAPTMNNPDMEKLTLVEHLSENDTQQVLTTLTYSVFSKEELVKCSRTGKRTGKCVGIPRPPLNHAKVDMLQRLVMKKTKMSKDSFLKKFENLQKTLRQKEQKKQDTNCSSE